ncbi:MAG: copper-binding protein [Candidatus Accumulibacter sp.]|uniref:copper-binding protein n=1 Tax=Accumulibacter sp. TaxID=2053492 RepID=UPI002879BB88|nr:copper-binding protein [Accumulibacter sp.]MDS4016074.1 copper-binding protein [Accumulibacter sp.]
MKSIATALLISLTALGSLSAGAGTHPPGSAAAAPTAGKAGTQMADGLVKKVDKEAGKLTLAHGPLQNLDMPAMTMVFRVKDSAWLNQLAAGDKIRFMAENVNGLLTVTHLVPVK